MLELYFSPGACSFVAHVSLEVVKAATGEDFKPNLVKLHKNEQKSAEVTGSAAGRGRIAGAVAVDDARREIDELGEVAGRRRQVGHGIGLDGHEWTNFVRGNKTPIQPGMCFSDEPTVVIYGEFGIRLEDCLYITPEGPKFFTKQSASIDEPF